MCQILGRFEAVLRLFPWGGPGVGAIDGIAAFRLNLAIAEALSQASAVEIAVSGRQSKHFRTTIEALPDAN
jgi:hypothetical protein